MYFDLKTHLYFYHKLNFEAFQKTKKYKKLRNLIEAKHYRPNEFGLLEIERNLYEQTKCYAASPYSGDIADYYFWFPCEAEFRLCKAKNTAWYYRLFVENPNTYAVEPFEDVTILYIDDNGYYQCETFGPEDVIATQTFCDSHKVVDPIDYANFTDEIPVPTISLDDLDDYEPPFKDNDTDEVQNDILNSSLDNFPSSQNVMSIGAADKNRNPRKSKFVPDIDPRFKKVEDFKVPAIVKKNKNTVQSWQLTKLRYDFTLCEKNIFLKVVDICQKYFIDKSHIGKDCFMDIYDTMMGGKVPIIYFPIKDILTEKGKNYDWVKKGLHSMLKKEFGIPGLNNWDYAECVLFQRVMSDEGNGMVGVILTVDFWQALCNLVNYKMINIDVATSFRSVYTERIYELLVGNKTAITYDIDNLKKMFCLEDKYKNTRHFLEYVVDHAKNEMQQSDICPIYFEYKAYATKGRKLDKIEFTVIEKAIQKELEDKEDKLQKMKEANAKVVLTDAVKQAMMACYPEVKLDREDVDVKLKNAQRILGVQELVDCITRIRIASTAQMDKGKLRSSKAAYFMGAIDKVVFAKEELEREKRTYHEPEKVVKPQNKDEWEDKEYKYMTDVRIYAFSSSVKLTIEQWAKKWGFEKIDNHIYRVRKDKLK